MAISRIPEAMLLIFYVAIFLCLAVPGVAATAHPFQPLDTLPSIAPPSGAILDILTIFFDSYHPVPGPAPHDIPGAVLQTIFIVSLTIAVLVVLPRAQRYSAFAAAAMSRMR